MDNSSRNGLTDAESLTTIGNCVVTDLKWKELRNVKGYNYGRKGLKNVKRTNCGKKGLRNVKRPDYRKEGNPYLMANSKLRNGLNDVESLTPKVKGLRNVKRPNPKRKGNLSLREIKETINKLLPV